MNAHAGAGGGVRHLAALAREPRPAGSDAEDRARRYAEQVLRDAGFAVTREPFDYSAFPGRYGDADRRRAAARADDRARGSVARGAREARR